MTRAFLVMALLLLAVGFITKGASGDVLDPLGEVLPVDEVKPPVDPVVDVKPVPVVPSHGIGLKGILGTEAREQVLFTEGDDWESQLLRQVDRLNDTHWKITLFLPPTLKEALAPCAEEKDVTLKDSCVAQAGATLTADSEPILTDTSQLVADYDAGTLNDYTVKRTYDGAKIEQTLSTDLVNNKAEYIVELPRGVYNTPLVELGAHSINLSMINSSNLYFGIGVNQVYYDFGRTVTKAWLIPISLNTNATTSNTPVSYAVRCELNFTVGNNATGVLCSRTTSTTTVIVGINVAEFTDTDDEVLIESFSIESKGSGDFPINFTEVRNISQSFFTCSGQNTSLSDASNLQNLWNWRWVNASQIRAKNPFSSALARIHAFCQVVQINNSRVQHLEFDYFSNQTIMNFDLDYAVNMSRTMLFASYNVTRIPTTAQNLNTHTMYFLLNGSVITAATSSNTTGTGNMSHLSFDVVELPVGFLVTLYNFSLVGTGNQVNVTINEVNTSRSVVSPIHIGSNFMGDSSCSGNSASMSMCEFLLEFLNDTAVSATLNKTGISASRNMTFMVITFPVVESSSAGGGIDCTVHTVGSSDYFPFGCDINRTFTSAGSTTFVLNGTGETRINNSISNALIGYTYIRFGPTAMSILRFVQGVI